MRVISGYLKSRVISLPKNARNVRPTTDRARETLFNIISNFIDFPGCRVLDLFAGSGSFGIECISRGAASCVFVDTNTEPLKKNIETLGLGDKSKLVKSDSLAYLRKNTHEEFSIVFADPPYAYGDYEKLLESVKVYKTYFILEHSEKFVNITDYGSYLFKNKKIGLTSFNIYNFSERYEE